MTVHHLCLTPKGEKVITQIVRCNLCAIRLGVSEGEGVREHLFFSLFIDMCLVLVSVNFENDFHIPGELVPKCLYG